MKKYKTYSIAQLKYIKIKISSAGKETYWVKIDTRLKRIARSYFLELKKKDIQLIENSKVNLKCLGLTKRGVQCKRFVKKDYCFQHKVKKDITNTLKKKKVVYNLVREITTKKELGQFYSINCDYILQGMSILKGVQSIIEPFGGCGSLVNWVYTKTNINVESYDISPKFNGVIKRDVFKDIPVYKDKFVITNPPYLSKNKAKEKTIFNLYKTDDLYKCFITQLLDNICLGGILIVPLNFFCSFRKKDLNLRKRFLSLYDIILINIFEEPVFSDTSYTVCSFMFKKKIGLLETSTKICKYPEKINFCVIFNSKNSYCISNHVFNLLKSKVFMIKRVTKFNCFSEYATNIVVQCIDNKRKNINASIVNTEFVYIDTTKNKSARSYLSLWIKPKISSELQEKLVSLFNNFVHEKRKIFFSLFLSQYREFGRKRISFKLVYDIFSHLFKTYVESGKN